MPTGIIIVLILIMIIGIVYVYLGNKNKNPELYKFGLGVSTGIFLLLVFTALSTLKVLTPITILLFNIITLGVPTYLMIGKWTPKFK